MKKTIKILLITICAIFVLSITNNTFAMSASDIKGVADDWLQRGEQSATITTNEAWNKIVPIGQLLVSIASVVLVICYMYIGIKYMMADPSGKADVKQRLIWLVIATVLIYGGVGIFTIVVNLMNSILE